MDLTVEFELTPDQMAQLAEHDENARFVQRFGATFNRLRFYVALCAGHIGFGTR
jgi:hypothetical protein